MDLEVRDTSYGSHPTHLQEHLLASLLVDGITKVCGGVLGSSVVEVAGGLIRL